MTDTPSRPAEPRRLRRALRLATYAGAAAAVLFALAVLVVYTLLPGISQRKAEIEQAISARIGAPVRIGAVEPYWDNLYPGARLRSVEIYRAKEPTAIALALPEVRASIAWLPFLWGELRLHSLELVHPDLALTRLPDGRIQVSGFDPIEVKAGGDNGALPWLFRQHELQVSDGRLTWSDRVAGEPALTVERLQVNLKNSGARHHIAIEGVWPSSLCDQCSFAADLIGNPLVPATWGGQARANLSGLSVRALPAIARERMPPELHGAEAAIDAEIWSQWQQGIPQVVSGEVAMRGVALPANRWSDALALPVLKGDFHWRQRPHGWDVYVGKTALGDSAHPWLSGGVYVALNDGSASVEIEQLDVEAAARVVTGLRGTNGGVALVRALKPQGRLRHFKLHLTGPLANPDDYKWEADVHGGAIAAYERYPGFKGLTGRAVMSRAGGRVAIKKIDGELFFQKVFAAPIPITSGAGRLAWERAGDHWSLTGKELRLRNRDGHANGEFELHIPFDSERSPWMRLEAEAPALNGGNAGRFYPVHVLKPEVRRWLERFIVSGSFQDVKVLLEGELRRFPFKDGSGKFEVRGRVRNGVFDYLPHWPRIEKAAASFAFIGASVQVNGGGRVDDLTVSDLAVSIPDLLAQDGAVVQIDGKAAGPVATALDVLRTATRDRPGLHLPANLGGRGNGSLVMSLTVPLRDPANFRVTSDYRFERASLNLGAAPLVDEMSGRLEFNQTGVTAGNLHMRALGGESELRIATLLPGRVRAEGHGQVSTTGLARTFGPALGRYFEGSAGWKGSFEFSDEAKDLSFEADLARVAFLLPAPLAKSVGAPLRFSLRTENADAMHHTVLAQLGERMKARVALEKGIDGWGLARARVHAGEGIAALPAGRGLQVSANWSTVDGDAWLDFLKSAFGNSDGEKGSDLPVWLDRALARISLDIDSLRLFAREFGRVSADVAREGNGWSGSVRGTSATGNVYLVPSGGNRVVQLNFDRLVIPRRTGPAVVDVRPPRPPPRNLPTVSVQCQSFQLGDYHLGRMALWGTPVPTGWKINHVVLSRPEMNVFFKGDWLMSPEQQRTNLEAELHTDDIGASLAAFGVRDQIQGGRATLKSHASWAGGPLDFDLNAVQAVVSTNAEKGQFLKIKQGAGKLLGIFDVNSLARYLSLDFSTLFGKGFAFDTISGDLSVQQGNATTRGISVAGPSADLNLAGRTGIAAEDFDLDVVITPHLRGSMAIVGGLYGGPIGLGTALLLERIMKKQIQKGTRVVYTVKGPWADPIVRRVIKDSNGNGNSNQSVVEGGQ